MSPLTLTWVNVKGLRYAFVDLVNVGTVPVSSATLLLDSVPVSGGNNTAPWLYFDACVGADWDAVSGSCSGTTVRVGASAGNALTSVVPITTGGRLSIRVLHSSNPNHFRSSLQVSVSHDQIRASATTNS
ncbi:hypothetical protein GCM10025789_01900 [Tessaracoccus lubricantis]|uniref:Uncharacterized protein n=2 Tax=Tessaracoccus lubricantis TaxID=545543 RepID=A0ABP9EXW2_9ACTN